MVFPSRQVAIEVFGFAIHWYGLLYLLGFLVAYTLIKRLQRYRALALSNDDVSSVLSWAVVGVILGGRLGYVLFYEPMYFLQNPAEIIAVWHGGMASHGGFIGAGLALWYILWKKHIPLLSFLDIATVPVALGLFFGRFGNFINWELYGTVTNVPWAMAIPGVEGLRHPTFFYAMIKNACIAMVCFSALRSARVQEGMPFALFLLLYGLLRFTVEFYREQPHGFTEIAGVSLSRGQVLTIPLILAGAILVLWLRRK